VCVFSNCYAKYVLTTQRYFRSSSGFSGRQSGEISPEDFNRLMRNATGDGEAAGDDSDLTADGETQAQLLAKAWAPVRFAVRRCCPSPVLPPEPIPRRPSRGLRFTQTAQAQ
jgi:hypothetical protein